MTGSLHQLAPDNEEIIQSKKLQASSTSTSSPSESTVQPSQTPIAAPATDNTTAVLVALTLATVNESLSGNMLMPFVGNLIASISDEPVADSGFISGFVVAAFHFGQMTSGTHWGRLGDSVGRRPVIFAGLCASIVTQILFGLAPNIWMLGLARFLQGVGNGNMATIKTVVAEISTKETEAFAFSLLTLAWGLGTLAGQAVGGLLYDPVKTWGWSASSTEKGSNNNNEEGGVGFFVKSLFVRFPALLPCLFGSLYGLVSLLVLMYYLQETNKRVVAGTSSSSSSSGKQQQREQGGWCGLGFANKIRAVCCCCCGSQETQEKKQRATKFSQLASNESSCENDVFAENSDYDNDDEHGADDEEMIDRSAGVKQDEFGNVVLPQDLADSQKLQRKNRRREHNNSVATSAVHQRAEHQQREGEAADGDDEEKTAPQNDERNPASPGSPHQRKPLVAVVAVADAAGGRREKSRNCSADILDDGPPQEDVDLGETIGLRGVFSLVRLRVAMICYLFLAAHDIGYVECLPLLAILSIPIGGFDLSVAQLGLLNTAIGLTQVSSNVIYPFMYRKMGKTIYPYSAFVTAATNFIAPFLTFAAATSAKEFFPSMATLMIVRQLAVSGSYTTISIMMKDASPRRYLGEIMGLTQSAASLVRLITPVIAAPFFAFTATHEWPLPHPHNVSLIFLICALLAAISGVYSASSMNLLLVPKKRSSCCCCCCSGEEQHEDDEETENDLSNNSQKNVSSTSINNSDISSKNTCPGEGHEGEEFAAQHKKQKRQGKKSIISMAKQRGRHPRHNVDGGVGEEGEDDEQDEDTSPILGPSATTTATTTPVDGASSVERGTILMPWEEDE